MADVDVAVDKPRKKLTKQRAKRLVIPYILSTPAIVLVAMVLAIPIMLGFWRSLFERDGLFGEPEWVGPSVYVDLFRDPLFTGALGRSAFLVFATIFFGMLLSIIYAMWLAALEARGANLLRTLMLIPYLISGVATAVIWRFLFSPGGSLAQDILRWLGLMGDSTWLADPNRALIVILIAHIWANSPLATLIMYGGLRTVPGDLYEAASIDGATTWQMFTKITLPWISPQVALATIWLSFASFNTFDLILSMTGGGPGRSTEVLALLMYAIGFQRLDFSGAYSIMVIILSINAILSIGYLVMIPRLRGSS